MKVESGHQYHIECSKLSHAIDFQRVLPTETGITLQTPVRYAMRQTQCTIEKAPRPIYNRKKQLKGQKECSYASG